MFFQYQMMAREHGEEGCDRPSALASSDIEAAQTEARALFVAARRTAVATDRQPPRAVCVLHDGVSLWRWTRTDEAYAPR